MFPPLNISFSPERTRRDMLTYQVRPRKFVTAGGRSPVFPCEGLIRFHFQPLQPFGMEAGGGRTAVQGVQAKVSINANTGEHTIQSEQPLKPLEMRLEEIMKSGEVGRLVEQKGNVFEISQRFQSTRKLYQLIESCYYGLPFLLNIEFADPPVISHVNGIAGGIEFRWELQKWPMCQFRTTTQKAQKAAIMKSWERLHGIDHAPYGRRLVAAIHYFYVACRLARQAGTPGEFLPEVLLNLAKTLEVLFPRSKDVGSIESARHGLQALKISQEIIEGSLLPALALRNNIDVGHVGLALFKMDELKVLHAYTERAENSFRDLLAHLLNEIKEGRFKLTSYVESPPGADALKIIARIRKYTADT
jgi:hypothetical protein